MNEEELEGQELDLQQLLEEEGDLAADYLEELLDIADLDGDIEISVHAERANVAIVSEDGGDRRLKRLIGKHGETLDALQELTRLAVQTQTGERSRLMLDLLNYREGKREKVQELAQEAVDEVLETGESVALKPMNPFERKVVHDVVAAAGLFSDSEGVGSARHVVIHREAPAGAVDSESADDFDDFEGEDVADDESLATDTFVDDEAPEDDE